jgi:hypothetical protein
MADKSTHRHAKMTLTPQAIIAVVLLLGLTAAAVFFLVLPQRRAESTARSKLAAQQQLESQYSARIAAIESGKQTGAKQLLAQARDLDKELPENVDKVTLVGQIPALAQKFGVTVNQMDPQAAAAPIAAATPDPAAATPAASGAPAPGTAPAAASSALQIQSFSAAVNGKPQAVLRFLAAVQSYPSILSISGLAISYSATAATGTVPAAAASPAAGSSPDPVSGAQALASETVTATFTLNAYYVPSPVLSSPAAAATPGAAASPAPGVTPAASPAG